MAYGAQIGVNFPRNQSNLDLSRANVLQSEREDKHVKCRMVGGDCVHILFGLFRCVLSKKLNIPNLSPMADIANTQGGISVSND